MLQLHLVQPLVDMASGPDVQVGGLGLGCMRRFTLRLVVDLHVTWAV